MEKIEKEKKKPDSYFGRILALNLAVVVLLHVGRQQLAPDVHIFGALFGVVLINLVMLIFFIERDESENKLACLVSAFVILLVGFSDCAKSL
ncbi:hypothetical protein SAMN02745146_2718 [Hymenobacter daecheongensis DSM 21074]|uniref:Uncharacterized protein n=1 Tax=Hymenobacter daecheongensis DSM 21074 TaxID=1121955 RepID=A0A1M6HZA1_9BACT|nr:hypothetical protein [Hymenobacter daecheongensis]SHJ27569.1 hypothetical protein SAMN02745146_2718 [Hymenobacter daecheongensis DSM 21074]